MIGVVKSVLAGTRFSCRDDADLLFATWLLTCVNYDHDHDHDHDHDRDAAAATDRMPARLCVNYAIPVRVDVRIFEDPCRRFKRNAMFPPVDAILSLIPRENHLYLLSV